MIWFTGDSHFGHERIIQLCSRPFSDIAEMDEVLIHNINDRVQVTDTLYHVGDFSWGRGAVQGPEHYLERINCKNIIMITGNHDPRTKQGHAKESFAKLFRGCYDILNLKVDINDERQLIILSHYAMRIWDRSHYGSWNLFGHSHGILDDLPNRLQIDVGVDCHNYAPISLYGVAQLMSIKDFTPLPRGLDSGMMFADWARANGEK